MFKHPKYYKELRKARNELAKRNAVKEDLACSGSSLARNKSDRVISRGDATAAGRRAPGLGHKRQAIEESVPHNDIEEAQASSDKLQATSLKLQAPSSSNHKRQASSVKHRGSSFKPQASSALIPDPGKSFTDL